MLTPAQLADLLQVEEEVVVELAEQGELPGTQGRRGVAVFTLGDPRVAWRREAEE